MWHAKVLNACALLKRRSSPHEYAYDQMITLNESMGHLVTAAVLLFNLVFYTAYSKEDKTLRFSVLLDVLLLRKGVGHTVNELNKIVALTGLTLAGIAFLPIHLFNSRTNLLWNVLYTQIFHALYSTYKFYGDKNMPEVLSWFSVFEDLKAKSKKQQSVGVKKVSNIVSIIAFAILIGIALNYFGMRKSNVAGFVMLLFSLTHFYTMEVDFKYNLKVRPWGFLPFYLVPVTLVVLLIQMFNVL